MRMSPGPLAGPYLSFGVETSSNGLRHGAAFGAAACSASGCGAALAGDSPPITATIAPTFATSPALTLISFNRPETTSWISIVTLSFSTSKTLSPSLIWSPTDLNQAKIFPSATVSPSCGMMTVSDIGLGLQNPEDLVGDARCTGQGEILEVVRCGQGDVRRGDADDRSVEVPEDLVGNDRCDLRAPAAEPWILFHSEEPSCFGDGPQNGLGIEGNERAPIDDFRVDSVLARQRRSRFERARDHERERDDCAVAASPKDLRGSELVDDLAVRHFALRRVEGLVLMEDDRVRVAHGRGHEANHVDGG